jgi:hypothetical protein
MKDRRVVAGLFIIPMLALAGLVIMQWRARLPERNRADVLDARTVAWRPATAEQAHDAQRIIGEQLQAFQHNDFDRAVRLECSSLQKAEPHNMLRDAVLVRYPTLHDFATAHYSITLATPDGDLMIVEVILTDKAGQTHDITYYLAHDNGKLGIQARAPGRGFRSDPADSLPRK